MTKKEKFTPILGSLDKLSVEEQTIYIARLCIHLGIPDDLGLVGLIWSDTGDGGRILVPYVKRGGTDIIRDRLGIDIKTMDFFTGDGFVAFKATATNKTGRQEIAIGACSIKSNRIDTALMTAETRAGRRVTLKFAGTGVLDESEVQEKTTNVAHDLQVASAASQPTVQPTTVPGRDVTSLLPPSVSPAASQEQKIVMSPGEPYSMPSKSVLFGPEVVPVNPPTLEPSNVVVRDAPLTVVLVEGVSKRHRGRPRGSKNRPKETGSDSPIITVSESNTPKIETPVPVPLLIEHTPNKEQAKEIKAKLFKYTSDIFPKGGMVPDQKAGGIASKAKLFIKLMFPNIGDTNFLSLEQWNSFFEFLDQKLKSDGTEGLVKFIDAQIGEALAK